MADVKLIKELRDRTGAGFLDVKKALDATDNDIEKSIEWLQERGAAKAAKKAGNIAAEGVVAVSQNDTTITMFEVNSQTDFVAKNEKFIELVKTIGDALLTKPFSSPEEANAIEVNGKTISKITEEATASIGEKIELRRAVSIAKGSNTVGAYVHTNFQVGAIVLTEGGTEDTIRNVAMHVASMNPQYLDEAAVPAEQVAEMKKDIMESDSLKSRPEAIQEKIAEGMLRKQLSELTLVDQEFVMEKMPVSKYLASNNAKATMMVRFEVGEGIEKVEGDFAAEVAAQMAG